MELDQRPFIRIDASSYIKDSLNRTVRIDNYYFGESRGRKFILLHLTASVNSAKKGGTSKN